MSVDQECCMLCSKNNLFHTDTEENPSQLQNILKAFKTHLPSETSKFTACDKESVSPKLCKPCWDNTRKLVKLNSLLDKLQFEIKEVVTKISLEISKERSILELQISQAAEINGQGGNARRFKPILPRPANNSSENSCSSSSCHPDVNNHISVESSEPKIHKISTDVVSADGSCFYCCESCTLNFLDGDELLLHIKSKDPLNFLSVYKCDKCLMTCTGKTRFEMHLRSHNIEQEMPYKCNQCNLRFATTLYLQNHKIKSHTATEYTYQCQFCLAIFNTPEDLTKHTILHSDRNKMKCYLCPEVLRTPQDFQQHIQEHKEGRAVKWGRRSSKKPKLQIETNNKPPKENPIITCEHCGKEFLTKRYLPKHLETCQKKLDSENQQDKSSTATTEDPLHSDLSLKPAEHLIPNASANFLIVKIHCEHCGQEFTRQSSLTKHLKTCSSHKIDIVSYFKKFLPIAMEQNLQPSVDKVVSLKCVICKEIFSKEADLMIHIQDYHNLNHQGNEFCNMKTEVEADSSGCVRMEVEEPSNCNQYEETAVDMEKLTNKIQIECFDSEGNENYVQIKSEPYQFEAVYEDVHPHDI